MALYSYSRWDGSQAGFDLDARRVMSRLNDDLIYHGDVGSALRRMMQHGFRDRTGGSGGGAPEMLERSGRRRRQEHEQHDSGGAYEEVANELNVILEHERRRSTASNRRPAPPATSSAERSPTKSWANAAPSSSFFPRIWPAACALSRATTSPPLTPRERFEHSWSACARDDPPSSTRPRADGERCRRA